MISIIALSSSSIFTSSSARSDKISISITKMTDLNITKIPFRARPKLLVTRCFRLKFTYINISIIAAIPPSIHFSKTRISNPVERRWDTLGLSCWPMTIPVFQEKFLNLPTLRVESIRLLYEMPTTEYLIPNQRISQCHIIAPRNNNFSL